MNQAIANELQAALEKFMPDEDVNFINILDDWQTFVKEMENVPCRLTPEIYGMALAASRHLIELVNKELSEPSLKAILPIVTPWDERYIGATEQLKRSVGDSEEGSTPWYSLRGPRDFASDDVKALWQYYFGNDSVLGLSRSDLGKLDTFIQRTCGDESESFARLAQYWKELVIHLEKGYSSLPDDFANAVELSREKLDSIFFETPPQVKEVITNCLKDWDDRFLKATQDEGKSAKVPKGISRFYHGRVPLKLKVDGVERAIWEKKHPVTKPAK